MPDTLLLVIPASSGVVGYGLDAGRFELGAGTVLLRQGCLKLIDSKRDQFVPQANNVGPLQKVSGLLFGTLHVVDRRRVNVVKDGTIDHRVG